MSRTTALVVAVALVAVAAAAWYRQQLLSPEAGISGAPRLAFITGGSGQFWQLTAEGARDAAAATGCSISIKHPSGDESLEEQMAILAQLSEKEFDGVAVSPLDSEGQTPILNRLQQRMDVITFDSDAPLSLRRGHVGTSNYGAGMLCAALVKEAVPDGGKVAVFMANLTKRNMTERKGGFIDGLAKSEGAAPDDEGGSEIDIVGYFTDEGNDKAAGDSLRKVLGEHSDLACIVGMNARHGPIIMRTLEAENLIGTIKVVAFDQAEETLDGVQSGFIHATIAQDPYKYGYEATRLLDQLCRKGDQEIPLVGGGTINIKTEAVRQDEVDGFRERWSRRVGERQHPDS